MSVKNFENNRWTNINQKGFFRHSSILGLVKEKNVLDIGCGDGLLLIALREKGVKGVGVDVSDVAIKKCREKGLEAVLMDVNDSHIPFPDKFFDLVILSDVLEHLYDPSSLLQEAKRLSGKILISVPNFNSLPARLQMLFGKIPENNGPNKGHVYWFNYSVLKNMLEKSGFKIETIETNTFLEKVPAIGIIMKMLKIYFPSLFALSYVVKAKSL